MSGPDIANMMWDTGLNDRKWLGTVFQTLHYLNVPISTGKIALWIWMKMVKIPPEARHYWQMRYLMKDKGS